MSLDVSLICPCCHTELFDANITHNLGKMAGEAGIYKMLWRPEEVSIETAAQLVEPLTVAIDLMKSDPARFKALNAANGWGTYEGFVPWIEKYRDACVRYPNAKVEVSR